MVLDFRNTWSEVQEAQPDTAVLPLGCTEQHGAHLPVGTIASILDCVARQVAQRLGGTVYLLPTLPFGTSAPHRGAPGTIALQWETMMAVVRDLVESLAAQGIRRVAVLNGLGGAAESPVYPRENPIVKTAVRQVNYDLPEVDVVWVEPFTAARVALADILDSATDDLHAGELATSVLLHLNAAAVKGPGVDCVPAVGKEYLEYVAFERLCPGGVWGRPSLATAEKGRHALEAAVEYSVEYIETSLAQLAAMKRRVDCR